MNFNAIPSPAYVDRRQDLVKAFRMVRSHSEKLTSAFSTEEMQLQSMPDASPGKWHLAHTTWFFETFLLSDKLPDYQWFEPRFCYLFNSYYNALGEQYPRPKRGLMVWPDLQGVMAYRRYVSDRTHDLLQSCNDEEFRCLAPILLLGLNHEQQHQELIVTDIQHALCGIAGQGSPDRANTTPSKAPANRWVDFEATTTVIGYKGDGFCFDNECAPHPVLLQPFRIARRTITNAEWLDFMNDGGYENPLLWLSDGWAWKNRLQIHAPMYWQACGGLWCRQVQPGRLEEIDPSRPVTHISYYEADAYACWRGVRLPREAEWEYAAIQSGWPGNDPHGDCHGCGDSTLDDIGCHWEWTQSAYSAYPGFRAFSGKAAEYNGKFMVNQMVLKGASEATAPFHSRPSYRNFFYPDARWQFTSLRLARDTD